jgi:putative membrane protein
MTATQGDLASLSRYIFRAPSWYRSLTLALALAALTGVAAFDSAYPLEDAWQGVFFVGLPTVAAAALTPLIDRQFGGQLTPNRASLLALSCELIVIGVLSIAGLIAVATTIGQEFVFNALLIALAAIFALRLLVVMAVSRQSPLVAAVPASVQTVAAAVLLFVYSGTMRYVQVGGGQLTDALLNRQEVAPTALQRSVQPADFVLLAAMCVLYAGAVWGFLLVIDQPWRRSLGVSVLDFIQGFIGHIAEGTDELEQFFEEIGEEALVPVTVLSFRRRAGGEKARFVLPMIHPGPIGEIGGGNLPVRIAEEADGLAFPPHATAGHDFNLVTRGEVETVCETAETAYQRIEYEDSASPARQLTEGEATLTGQSFGDDALVVNTFSPSFSDDVEFAVGLSAAAEARRGGLDDVLLVDAHNCNNGLEGDDIGHVVPGSRRSFDMIHGAGRLGTLLADEDHHPVRLGVAWERGPWEAEEGVGPLGIRVAVTEVDDQRTAYVLVDGNNMEPGLRERIVSSVDGVDLAEVMTSDTHVVNTVEAENQVGDRIETDALIGLVDELVGRAIDDLEPVEGGMATEKAQVTVFGNDRTETLASHANATVQMGLALAATVVFSVLTLTMLLFFLT